MLLEAAVTGGVLYTGLRLYKKRRAKSEKVWLVEFPPKDTPTSEEQLDENRHYLAITTVSLGLSASGALLYAPLGLASIPLNLYSLLPRLVEGWKRYQRNIRLNLVGAGSAVFTLASILAQHYFIASLIDWTYQFLSLMAKRIGRFNRRLLEELEYSYRHVLYNFLSTKPDTIQVTLDGMERQIPFDSLKVGDVIVVDTYQVVPVDGTVSQGSALVDCYALTGETQPIELRAGSPVFATSIVLSGRLLVEVTGL